MPGKENVLNEDAFKTALASLLMLVAVFCQADTKPAFQWPGNARAAVNLAYDDALDSQLDQAIPALNRYGFKGSFYLTLASDTVRLRLDEWRAAAANGHELGNHTLFHPCSASLPDREWVKPQHDLDRIQVDELRERILLANSMLHAIDGQMERTFTAPCADLEAAGVPYLEAVQSQFVAIKAYAGGVTPDMEELDPWSVGVTGPVGLSGEQLIGIVKEAAEKGTMANFTFHGIGGDYLSVSREAHEELLRFLDQNRDIYWVDTFINIMHYVKDQN